MLDTKGPEIRTKNLKVNPDLDGKRSWRLEKGNKFVFHCINTDFEGDATQVGVTYANFAKVVSLCHLFLFVLFVCCSTMTTIPTQLYIGQSVLIDDGLIACVVDKIDVAAGTVETTIQNTGILSTHKGVNLPGTKVDLPAVTERDKLDIAFGVKNKVDFIAASFIRNAANVREIRDLPGVRENNIKIISKIECVEGMEDFLNILNESDGIMVARGDLAGASLFQFLFCSSPLIIFSFSTVEIPLEKVPAAQKMMIRNCNRVGKPVITATQMMESMTNNPRPTRAEVTDVANAVFDGTDCVMLSGESANGKYPALTVETMVRICLEAEKSLNYRALYRYTREGVQPPIPYADSIASSTVKTAWDIEAKAIVALTESGRTAHLISKYRPNVPVICVTPNEQVARQAVIFRSLYPLIVPHGEDITKIGHTIDFCRQNGFASPGDSIVVASGKIANNSGATNTMTIEKVPK